MSRLALILLSMYLLAPPVTAQVIDKDEALQRLLAVEEHFSKIRKKCCALMTIVSSVDDPASPLPVSVLVHSIYAKNAAGAVRHDIGFSGDALVPKDSRQWLWNRTLKVNGKAEVRLQGHYDGGISDSKEPLFFKMFDPLCVSTGTYVDVLSGKVGEAWFATMFANAEYLEGATTKDGDLKLVVVTAKNRKCIAIVVLSKAVGYLPTNVQFYHNVAEDVSRSEKLGVMFGEARTEWTKAGDNIVPRVVTIESPKESEGVRRHHEIEMAWLLSDFDESLVFNEDAMRNRWDSLETLWLDLNASKKLPSILPGRLAAYPVSSLGR